MLSESLAKLRIAEALGDSSPSRARKYTVLKRKEPKTFSRRRERDWDEGAVGVTGTLRERRDSVRFAEHESEKHQSHPTLNPLASPIRSYIPKVGRTYEGMGDFTPSSHAFRDREPEYELGESQFRTMRRWEPRHALRGGGERSLEKTTTLHAKYETKPPIPFPDGPLPAPVQRGTDYETSQPRLPMRDERALLAASLSGQMAALPKHAAIFDKSKPWKAATDPILPPPTTGPRKPQMRGDGIRVDATPPRRRRSRSLKKKRFQLTANHTLDDTFVSPVRVHESTRVIDKSKWVSKKPMILAFPPHRRPVPSAPMMALKEKIDRWQFQSRRIVRARNLAGTTTTFSSSSEEETKKY